MSPRTVAHRPRNTAAPQPDAAAVPASAQKADPPRPKDPGAGPTTRLLKQHVRNLFRHLPLAVAGGQDPVHQMRVAARRLRVALPLLCRKAGGKRVRRAVRLVRDLTRGGGGSRDLDVIAGLLEARLEQASSAELKVLVRDLRSARTRSRERLAGDLLDVDIARLRRDLATITARRGVPTPSALRRLGTAVTRAKSEVLETLDGLGETFDPPRLHRVRSRFRWLRYAAELADALGERDSGAPAELRRVQVCLGSLHDAFVLSLWLERKAARAEAAGRPQVAQCARLERDCALDLARVHHREFLAMDPRALLARGVEATAVPLSVG